MYEPFGPPGIARRTLMDRLRLRVRWYHIPLAASAFVFWFYMITVITSLLIPLDVTFYGNSQIEFIGETPGGTSEIENSPGIREDTRIESSGIS